MQTKIITTGSLIQVFLVQKQLIISFFQRCWSLHSYAFLIISSLQPFNTVAAQRWLSLSCPLLSHLRQTFTENPKKGRDKQVSLSPFKTCWESGWFSGAVEMDSFGESDFSYFLRKMNRRQSQIHSKLFCWIFFPHYIAT